MTPGCISCQPHLSSRLQLVMRIQQRANMEVQCTDSVQTVYRQCTDSVQCTQCTDRHSVQTDSVQTDTVYRQTQHFLWCRQTRGGEGGGQLFPFAKVQDLLKASTAFSDALCLNSLPLSLSLGFPHSRGGGGGEGG